MKIIGIKIRNFVKTCPLKINPVDSVNLNGTYDFKQQREGENQESMTERFKYCGKGRFVDIKA